MLVCTLGDALLDVVVRLDGPIAPDTDAYGTSRVGAGGQAANVAAWVSALGGRGRFVGKRARDAPGRIVEEELQARDVELLGPVVDGSTGTVVSIATPDGQRSMLSDRGVSPQLEPDELDDAWFHECDWLHLPGYSLVRDPIAAAARRAAQSAVRVSVDASSTAAVEAFGADAFVERLRTFAPTTVFANEDEAALLGELEVETLVVKRGERGCLVRRGSTVETHAAPRVDAVDTTGAGDAFAAGFLVGGPAIALEAASRCVGTMGAMP